MKIFKKYHSFCKILIIGNLIMYLIACETKLTSLSEPPLISGSSPCNVIKLYCEPEDSCDYQYIKANFYTKNNGHIYQRKEVFDNGCCNFLIDYDSTMGYWETKQPIKDVVDLDSYVDIDSSSYSKDKNHVYWMTSNSDGGHLDIIEEADPKTFKRIAAPSNKLAYDYRWGQDKKYVYFKGTRLEGLNTQKAQFLRLDSSDIRPDYIKDNNFVFYQYTKIENADVKTFRVVDESKLDYTAIDKYRKYRSGEPIK